MQRSPKSEFENPERNEDNKTFMIEAEEKVDITLLQRLQVRFKVSRNVLTFFTDYIYVVAGGPGINQIKAEIDELKRRSKPNLPSSEYLPTCWV